MVNIATAADWEHLPMPTATRQEIPFRRNFSAAEMARIQLGLMPEAMEDKWFIYYDNQALYFYRSWTGFAIYEVKFSPPDVNGNQQAMMCWVNCDVAQNEGDADEEDREMLDFLINELLLGQPSLFPTSSELSVEQEAILRHVMIGYGRSNQAPDETPS